MKVTSVMSGSDDISTGSSFNLVFSEESGAFLNLDDSVVRELYNCETKVDLISNNGQNNTGKNISKAPVTCLVKACRKIMSGREVLSHFLDQHRDENNFEVMNVVENVKCLLSFDCKKFPLGENVCLGIIAYDGKGTCRNITQRSSGISMSNISLPKNYQNLSEHLPILIIGCMTYSSVVYSSKEHAKDLYKLLQENERTEHRMLCLWLASSSMTTPLYATMKVQSPDQKTSLEVITRVRNFSESHDIKTFAHDSTDTLNLSNGFLKRLTRDFRESIELELILYEYDI